jgi:enoyl-CoA hydratase/carnithine racemase
MPDDVILMEKIGLVATIILNRPEKHNSLNPDMLLKIAAYFHELSKTDGIRAVVIRGQGEKSFSSGYDINELPTDISEEVARKLAGKNPLEIGLGAIERYPYPVIAMIDGYAFGAGCELAITCDIRIASDTSKMGIPPSRLGVVYHPEGIQKFINVMGFANAKEAFITGRFYDMARAYEMGMVNYVVPKAELHSFTFDMAEEIAGNSPLSVKGHKHIFNKLTHYQGIKPEDREQVERMILESLNSEDLKEGAIAFLSKRKAEFKGK